MSYLYSMTNRDLAHRLRCICGRLTLLLGGRGPSWMRFVPPLTGPAFHVIGTALRSLLHRFERIAALADAGALPAARTPSPASRPPRTAKPITTPSRWPHRLDNRPGWLMRLVSPKHVLPHCADQLRQFVQEPDFLALLAQAPQIRRIVRPLCTMFSVELPPKPRPIPPEPAAKPTPTPSRRRQSRRPRYAYPFAQRGLAVAPWTTIAFATAPPSG